MNPTTKWVVFYTPAAFYYMDNLSGAGFSIDSNETGQRSYKSSHPFWAAHSRIPVLVPQVFRFPHGGLPVCCVFKAGGCDDCRYNNTPCNNCLPSIVSTQLQGLCNAAEQTQLLQMFRRGRRTFFFHLFRFGAGQFRKLLLKIVSNEIK